MGKGGGGGMAWKGGEGRGQGRLGRNLIVIASSGCVQVCVQRAQLHR